MAGVWRSGVGCHDVSCYSVQEKAADDDEGKPLEKGDGVEGDRDFQGTGVQEGGDAVPKDAGRRRGGFVKVGRIGE